MTRIKMPKERVTVEGFEFDLRNPHEGCWIVTTPLWHGFIMNEKTRDEAIALAPQTWRWFVAVCEGLGYDLSKTNKAN